jgi:hypothetical protein
MQASYRGKNTAREFDWRVASVSVMFLNQNEGVPVPRCWGPGTEAYDLPLDQILTKSRQVSWNLLDALASPEWPVAAALIGAKSGGR